MDTKEISSEEKELEKRESQIDNAIYEETKKLSQIESIQDELTKINRSLNNCIELLSSSMKGPKVDTAFKDIYDAGNKATSTSMEKLINEYAEIRNNLDNLEQERKTIIEEKKNEDNN